MYIHIPGTATKKSSKSTRGILAPKRAKKKKKDKKKRKKSSEEGSENEEEEEGKEGKGDIDISPSRENSRSHETSPIGIGMSPLGLGSSFVPISTPNRSVTLDSGSDSNLGNSSSSSRSPIAIQHQNQIMNTQHTQNSQYSQQSQEDQVQDQVQDIDDSDDEVRKLTLEERQERAKNVTLAIFAENVRAALQSREETQLEEMR